MFTQHSLVFLIGFLLLSSSCNRVAFAFTATLIRRKDVSLDTRFPSLLSQVSMSSSSDIASTVPIVALNVILRIKPKFREKFLQVIINNQNGTLNKELEPLALEYVFGEDTSEPNTFHFHEKYLGEEGIAAHNAAPHFIVWEEFAQTNPFSSPPEVYKYVIYND